MKGKPSMNLQAPRRTLLTGIVLGALLTSNSVQAPPLDNIGPDDVIVAIEDHVPDDDFVALLGSTLACSANGEPAGGSYAWDIKTGTGAWEPVGSGRSIDITFDSVGSKTVRVTYTLPDGRSDWATVGGTVVTANLLEISFTGDHQIYENSADTDHEGWGVGATAITDPVWTSTGTDKPVCYTKNSQLAMTLKLDVIPDLPTGKELPVTLVVSGDYAGSASVKLKGSTVNASLTTTTRLADEVYKDMFGLTWSVTQGSTSADIGTSEHTIYVTYDAPKETVTPKRLNQVCSEWACGQTTKHGAAESLGEQFLEHPPYFSPVGRIRSDKTEMWYMMETSDPHPGDCIAYAQLKRKALRSIGIDCAWGAVFASHDDGKTWMDREYHPEHPNWLLAFTGTPGFNAYEGAIKLQDGGTWYCYSGNPNMVASHNTEEGAAIILLRTYVGSYGTGKQEYYIETIDAGGIHHFEPTGVEVPLPPAP
jgi:hypothetical protein